MLTRTRTVCIAYCHNYIPLHGLPLRANVCIIKHLSASPHCSVCIVYVDMRRPKLPNSQTGGPARCTCSLVSQSGWVCAGRGWGALTKARLSAILALAVQWPWAVCAFLRRLLAASAPSHTPNITPECSPLDPYIFIAVPSVVSVCLLCAGCCRVFVGRQRPKS